MSKVILGMTMSLDGLINDRQGSVEILYPDLAALRHIEPLKGSIQNTGAVVMELPGGRTHLRFRVIRERKRDE